MAALTWEARISAIEGAVAQFMALTDTHAAAAVENALRRAAADHLSAPEAERRGELGMAYVHFAEVLGSALRRHAG